MGGSTHPNVPFLAWAPPTDATANGDSPSRAGGWDREGLGWSGFRTSDRLLLRLWGWLGLGVITVVAVGSTVADLERLTEMLKLAVTPLAVLFPLASAPSPGPKRQTVWILPPERTHRSSVLLCSCSARREQGA